VSVSVSVCVSLSGGMETDSCLACDPENSLMRSTALLAPAEINGPDNPFVSLHRERGPPRRTRAHCRTSCPSSTREKGLLYFSRENARNARGTWPRPARTTSQVLAVGMEMRESGKLILYDEEEEEDAAKGWPAAGSPPGPCGSF